MFRTIKLWRIINLTWISTKVLVIKLGIKTEVFQHGGLIFRRAKISKPLEQEKLLPNWNGPYKISKVIKSGAYNLKNLNGTLILRSSNFDNLRNYYQ